MKLSPPQPGPPVAPRRPTAVAALLGLFLGIPLQTAAAQEPKGRAAATPEAATPEAEGREAEDPHAVARDRRRPAAGARDPDGLPFRTPIASPLEPASRLSLAHIARDTADRTVALPDLAAHIPFRLRDVPRGEGWSLAGAVVAGVFSRFDLESADNEFLEVHYRAALRLRAGRGAVAARLALYHVSSHLGDEYQERTGRVPVSTSREGLELLVQAVPVPGLSLYGGPGLLLRSSRGFARPSLRAGAEWRPGDGGSDGWYAAVEAYSWAELDWEPRLAAEAGRRLGRRFRLGVVLGLGPSRAEQFLREEERLLGLAFTLLP